MRLIDERLSTATASRAMREAGRSAKSQRSSIDQAAAVVILDTVLDAASGGIWVQWPQRWPARRTMTDLFEAETTTTTSLDLRGLQRSQRRATRRKWALVFIAVGLVLVASGGFDRLELRRRRRSSKDTTDGRGLRRLGQGTVQVIIEPGDTGADIAATLVRRKGSSRPSRPTSTPRNANPDSAGIKPGYYFMQREMKAEYALDWRCSTPTTGTCARSRFPRARRSTTTFDKIARLTEGPRWTRSRPLPRTPRRSACRPRRTETSRAGCSRRPTSSTRV